MRQTSETIILNANVIMNFSNLDIEKDLQQQLIRNAFNYLALHIQQIKVDKL